MENLNLDGLKGLDSETQARLLLGLQILFFLITFRVLWLQFKTRRLRFASKKKPAAHHLGLLYSALCLLFLGALGYQATWHLMGLLRPEFVAFMQRYDRRLFNPARQLDRGKILDRNQILLAKNQKANGIHRQYPFGARFAHSVGYFHPVYGLNGIEKALDGHLAGTRAESIEDWEQLGKNILTQEKTPAGKDIRLTLHAQLQSAAYDFLGNRKGAILVMGVHSGALYVLCSRPAFDPNRLTSQTFHASRWQAPLLNRALHGIYPPGSTFKIAIAACALDHRLPDQIQCRSEFRTSASVKPIRDHHYYEQSRSGNSWKGYGKIGLETAFIKSSNVYFAQLGVMIGQKGYRWIAKNMRFNRGIPIVKSRDGNIEAAASHLPLLKSNDQYGLAQMGIGQGQLSTTPLQMALMVAAVANEGVAPVPRIIANQKPTALGRFMTAKTADKLGRMLRRVVTEGTAQKAKALPLAGKTGTAENKGAAHSWFIGYYPFELPQLVICVMIENGGYGSAAALPVSMKMIRESAKLGLFKMPTK